MMDSSKSAYWDRYYAGAATASRPVPSQFAVFVAGELAEPHRIVEFGCGNGRDSLFFASNGHQVIGLDGSTSAIERGSALADQFGEKVEFLAADVNRSDLVDLITDGGGRTVVYARFFVHAITEDEQSAFLDTAARLTKPGDLLAVEYRTVRDQSGAKETGDHYRRFVSPAEFDHAAAQRGFTVQYAVEGFGFAKYKHDDAYVARRVLART
ncbi:Methyltransferase domain-containing protein [Microlunatus soli]|uniref:Methyltransferase domain-containing protein n=2 Tax=Microlunatus soli TaxID=630515 RepID=A0A1H1M9G4_9ACTN|nr:Methyltransferase domain-containing protein [Microlunatus soli]